MGRGQTLMRCVMVSGLAATAAPLFAQSSVPQELEPERREVEAWVKADIERALRFYQDVRPMYVRWIAKSETPASPEQASARLERLAALRRQIEDKPEHPLRSEYAELFHYAPGGSTLVEQHVWIGRVNGRLVWRESATIVSDAIAEERRFDFGVSGSTAWQYSPGNGTITLSEHPPPRSPDGLRSVFLSAFEDLCLGWATTEQRDGRPRDLRVERVHGANDATAESRWTVRYSAEGIERAHTVLWDRERNMGLVEERVDTWRSGSAVLRRLFGPMSEGVSTAVPARVVMEMRDSAGAPRRITTIESIVVEDLDETALLKAACIPATSGRDGQRIDQQDVIRGTLNGNILVDDRRTGHKSTLDSLWTTAARDLLLGSSADRKDAPARNVDTRSGSSVAQGGSLVERSTAIGLVVAFVALCVWRLIVRAHH